MVIELAVAAAGAAGLTFLAGWLQARDAPVQGLDAIAAAERAEREASVALAAGLPGRLDEVADLPALGRALVERHGTAATADLAAALAGVPGLREAAARAAADAARAAAVLARNGRRAPKGDRALRARRAVHEADVAVAALEALAGRLRDREALLSGGRDRVVRALAEHEARYAAIVAANETEVLRLTRPDAGPLAAPGPLGAADERLRALRAQVRAAHPALSDLDASLEALDEAMARLERDVERARWEAGRRSG